MLIQGGETLEQRYVMVQNHMKDIQNQMTNLKNAFIWTQKKLLFYEKLLEEPSCRSILYIEEWDLFVILPLPLKQ